jgi:hypothetical protein
MFMKRGLVVVIALLAVASIMAAMAYTSATVTSDASLNMVSTNSALLALTPSDFHNAAYYGSHPSNARTLVLDLDKGYNNNDFGVQPSSKYLWDDLFNVKNNSENDVRVKVKLDPNCGGRVNVYARIDSEDWVRLNAVHGNGGALEFDLESNGDQWIDIKTENSKGMAAKPEEYKWDLVVEAETDIPH